MMKNLYLLLFIMIVSVNFLFGQGSRYTGLYEKSSPIQYIGKKNIVIEGLEFGAHDAQRTIELYACENVIIRNCKFHSNPTKQIIYLSDSKNITITDCTFEDIRIGLVAHKCESVRFDYNEAFNLKGVDVEPNRPLGTLAHFDKCFGRNNSISYNVCENIFGESNADDIVNVFNSHGTQDSPLIIKGNWFRGGGPSYSGGGIMMGDYGGSYQIAEENILVDVGQYGIAIAGGHDNTIRNNKIYGRKQDFTNVAIYALNWSPDVSGESYNIRIENNRVNYKSMTGADAGYWFSPEMKPILGEETNVFDKNLSPSILPEKIIGRARNSNNSNNNNNNNNTPEGSIVPEPEKPDVTPPSQGGIGGEDQGKGPENTPDDEVVNTSIVVYLDNYNRICINTKNRVTRTSNVAVFDNRGNRLYTQPLVGYHTVVRKRFNRGTYDVRVKNGSHQKNAQLIIR